MEQVSVVMEPSSDTLLVEDFILPISQLVSQETGAAYASFSRQTEDEDDQGNKLPTLGMMTNTLKFISKEVDPETNMPEDEGYSDNYNIENIDLAAKDYIIPSYVSFSSEWDKLQSAYSATETFGLSAMESLKGNKKFQP